MASLHDDYGYPWDDLVIVCETAAGVQTDYAGGLYEMNFDSMV